jgi:hypothetical protein
MKIHPCELYCSMRTDGHSNMNMTKLIDAFSNFGNMLKKMYK